MRTQISSVVCTNRSPWRAATSTPISRTTIGAARCAPPTFALPLPYRKLMQTGGEQGGLKQKLALFDEAASALNEPGAFEERLRDDESDVAADRRQMQQAASASSTDRRAHAVTRADDLLPLVLS